MLQKKFLLFTTGSDRVPVGGMQEMTFKISKLKVHWPRIWTLSFLKVSNKKNPHLILCNQGILRQERASNTKAHKLVTTLYIISLSKLHLKPFWPMRKLNPNRAGLLDVAQVREKGGWISPHLLDISKVYNELGKEKKSEDSSTIFSSRNGYSKILWAESASPHSPIRVKE